MKILAYSLLTTTVLAIGSMTPKGCFAVETTKRDHSITRDCFKEHLKEAIATNRERRELYATLTNGESRKITRELIFAEKFGVAFMAPFYDRDAKIYQDHGINIVCDEMISPYGVPVFNQKENFKGLVPAKFISTNPKELRDRLDKALLEKGFEEVAKLTEEALAEIAQRPNFNCLMRNDLTTILKAARLAPIHKQKALALGLPSPESISRKLIKRITSILPFVDKIDKKVFAIQRQGIPFVCQDFPEATVH